MKKSFIIVPIILISICLIFSLTACSVKDDSNFLYDNYGVKYAGVYGDYESSENYTEIIENDFISTETNNVSYFSIDANTASYPNLRKRIMENYNIPKDAVRVEEMLNYFSYDYVKPTDGSIMSLTSSVFDNPYNPQTKLMTIGLASKEVAFSNVKNNLVFLIDVSGSMYSADKLPLVQESFKLLVENLNAEDRISIVTYAGNDNVALKGAYGNEKQKIMAVIEDLVAGGSTAGSEGIKTAYNIARECFIEGGNNRVILATDGDFNVGISNTTALGRFIGEKRESGIYFSVYGFGTGNIQSDLMETLALEGNGVYSYIDSIMEARRALVTDIGGSLVTVAKDVKAGVTFNKDYVDSYRLIGYENKLLTEDEFNDDKTDAGELGSGHTVTIVYEIKLKERELVENEKFAEVILKYKPTENSGDDTLEQSITLGISTNDYRTMNAQDAFISSVIEFALILRESNYKANADLNALITRLDNLDLSSDQFKAEFRDVVKKYRENING